MSHAARAALLAAVTLTGCAGTGAQLRKASAYVDAGRPGAAIRAYEDVLERKPGHPAALVGLAQAWIAHDQPERAIVPAQVAVEMDEPGARTALARALILTGRGAEALPVLRAQDPQWTLIAEALLASGDLDGAVEAAEEALKEGGKTDAQVIAAWLHARTDNCERAMSLASRALTAAMSDALVQAEAAAVFRHCGDAERAQATASTALTLQAAGPDPWQAEAARFSKGGDNEGAARRLSRLRAVWPQDGLVAKDLGAVWSSLGADQLAERELRQALDLPPFAVVRSAEGVRVVQRQSDSLDKAERRAGLRDIHLRLAAARQALGDLPGAAESLEAVAVLDVSDVDRWLAAAAAWAHARQPKRGIKAAAEAVRLAPRSARVQAVASELYGRAGDVARAIGHGRLAWELDPTNADLALSLSKLYAQRGERREARRILEVTARQVRGDARLGEALKALDDTY